MASPQSLVFWEGGAYFVNWFGVGNGVSFSLISLVSWAGGGDNWLFSTNGPGRGRWKCRSLFGLGC